MKVPALALWFLPAVALASACASSRTSSMPDWKPDETRPVAAGVKGGDDPVRVPSDVQDSSIRVPQKDANDAMRIPRPVEERQKAWPATGLYIGGSVITSQPGGDFDGNTALVGPTDVITVPDIDVGAGGGLYVSYRWHMNEIQLQYSITEHDGSFPGSPRDHDTKFYDFDVNWRHYIWEQSPFQPYGLLGLGIGSATIENGSTDQATGTVFKDAEMKDGISVNLGIGLAFYPLPGLMFFGQGMYRFVRYETSDGIDGEFANTPDIDGDGWNVSFGAAIRLLPPRD